MDLDRTIPSETLDQMVEIVRPGTTVREASLVESGHLTVYHLVVDTDGTPNRWVLKASPDGESHGIDTEARLLSIVAGRTSIPVPAVVGAVDEHDRLPAPYLVMEALEGEAVPKRTIGDLPDALLERVSRESGRYLADLHSLSGPSGFGFVDIDPGGPPAGERPSDSLESVTVTALDERTPADDADWPTVLRNWIDSALARHESTRFGDLTDEIRPTLLEPVESMAGPFEPVLGRIDHGLHNVLLDAETNEITGVIDWAFTLSVPVAYDLVCVEANLSLDPWSVYPDTPNRRQLVGRCLREGYRAASETAGDDVLD